MAEKLIEIYDTTLRDGAQMRGISFSVQDKLNILKTLDEFGVAYVEGGWPGANPKDVDFFVEAAKLELKNTKLVAFGSTRKANTTVEEDPILKALIRAATDIVCIVCKSSSEQINNTMKASPEENLIMLTESVTHLKANAKQVFVDAEHFFDGYKNDAAYAHKFIETAISAGASYVVLCDTNGGSLPEHVFQITQDCVKKYGEQIKFGIHAHNDSDLAVANSIRAIRAGATQVQGTINGYGERCGNANLISIIANLQLKYSADKLDCIPEDKLPMLTAISKKVAEIANFNHDDSQPFVGSRAFTHKGGLHASAVQKHKSSYEHIDPAVIGNRTTIVVSDQSGLSNILDWIAKSDIDFTALKLDGQPLDKKAVAAEILKRTKELENQGYSFENANASFELLVREVLAQKFEQQNLYPQFFELLESNVHVVNGEKTEATVRIKIADQEIHSASLGNGPANALDTALRKALRDNYPEIDNFVLLDFKVRILDSHIGSGAITKVQVATSSTESNDTWDTIGISPNIIKASWDAIVKSLEYGLIKQRVKSLTAI